MSTMMKAAMLLLSVLALTSAGSINCKSFIAMHSKDPHNRCFEDSSTEMIQTLALPVIHGWEEKDGDNDNNKMQHQSQVLRGSSVQRPHGSNTAACSFKCNKGSEYSQNQLCQVLAPCNTFQDDSTSSSSSSSSAVAIVERLSEDGVKTGIHFQRMIKHLIGHKCIVNDVTFEIWQQCRKSSSAGVAGGDSSLQQVQ
jgi:hypothetical protein